jgi:hypothetical protein
MPLRRLQILLWLTLLINLEGQASVRTHLDPPSLHHLYEGREFVDIGQDAKGTTPQEPPPTTSNRIRNSHDYDSYSPQRPHAETSHSKRPLDGPNLYAYVKQNSWTHWDPEGLWIGCLVDVAFMAWDTYQVHSGGISRDTYTKRMALSTACLALNVASGGVGGNGLRMATAGARIAETGAMLSRGERAVMRGTALTTEALAHASDLQVNASNNRGESPTSSSLKTQQDNAVQEGEAGSYGDLKSRSRIGDGLSIHEMPSSAAQIAAKERELGRTLSPAEKLALKKTIPSVAIREETHALTRTYKGNNTAEKIAADSADLERVMNF